MVRAAQPRGREIIWYSDSILIASDSITHVQCVNSHIDTVGVGNDAKLASVWMPTLLQCINNPGTNKILFCLQSFSFEKTNARYQVFVMNSIRCSSCGSIDPTTYTNRLFCCEYTKSLVAKLPGTSQFQFSTLTGKVGLFCERGCCDFSQKFERHFCLK